MDAAEVARVPCISAATERSARPLTPDFIDHRWEPLATATLAGGFVSLAWPDGLQFEAYSLWLAENAEGTGLEPSSRESVIDPTDLPHPGDLTGASIDTDGALLISWASGTTNRIHPGWLRYVALQQHLPLASLPRATPWTAESFAEPPSVDGTDVLDDADVLTEWLNLLVTYGLARLRNLPTTETFVQALMARIGPIRDSNFGPVWSVRAVLQPDSTANTGLNLGQHTDLPTRETPPGFQFLHCVENTVEGGWSRMTDGESLVAALRAENADAYHALSTLEWVFLNRAPDAEHRWIGPIIDHGAHRQPLTLRAFYPVRMAPNMDATDIPRAYESLRVFSRLAQDPRFQIRYPFVPGDLVGFDNRRVLHGRDSFDSGGRRHLRGCYVDQDDVYSRLRILRRRSTPPHEPESEITA